MKWTDLRLRLRALVFRKRMDQELRGEMEFHLDMMVRRNVARGMSVEEARRHAALRFGPSPAVLEGCRDERRVNLAYGLGNDIRYALRQFRRAPAVLAICVLSLGGGIGGNPAIFSIGNGGLLRPVGFQNP